ncbi:hypothetical protein MAR_026276 [Mya arenaria]|uniref:ATP synthase F0 subunit 8 n=1 Tax=Mya arenaria TaxID=6604 RepID=A0ABY7ETS2_MYAAR|nr:hypothetical protein MAR_026276 [Mya arenaria]
MNTIMNTDVEEVYNHLDSRCMKLFVIICILLILMKTCTKNLKYIKCILKICLFKEYFFHRQQNNLKSSIIILFFQYNS